MQTSPPVAAGVRPASKTTPAVVEAPYHQSRSRAVPPFQHFVGRLRRGKFHAAMHQGAAYNTWVELGPLGEDRVFKLFHNQAALALGGAMQAGDAALRQITLQFAGKSPNQQVLGRPVKPHEMEVCNASNIEAAQAGEIENRQGIRRMPLRNTRQRQWPPEFSRGSSALTEVKEILK